MAEHAGKPKVRFAGFTETWEQRKLGEIGKAYSGVGFPDNEQGRTEGIPFFKVSDMNSIGNENELQNANNYVDIFQISRHKWKPITEVPAIFFAKVGAAVMLNRKRLVQYPFLLDNNTMAYSFEKGIWNISFGKSLFETIDLTSLVQVGALPSYNASDVEDIKIFLPSLPEQARIGTFFRQLDRLITLHQRKRGRLENIKKAMLEKMFPKNGADVPEVRFAGFTEAWEQRKVGNLIEDYVERTTIQNQYPVLTSSQQQGIVLQEAYFADRQVTTNDNVGYFVLPKGYFTYRSRSDTDVFVFNRNDILDKGIISYYYPVFQTKYTCSDFLLRRLNHGIRKQLAMAAEGTGQKVLAHSKFKNMTVSVPKIGEQQKIGTFFRQLDRLITLHQRKVALLQNIKKACLEKMFV